MTHDFLRQCMHTGSCCCLMTVCKPYAQFCLYVSHKPSMLHASQLVHPFCEKLQADCPIAVQSVAAQTFTFCTMSCHYLLNCRCLDNHNGSCRPHHSDISIHTGYMILACQPQVMLANMLQVIMRISESAPRRCVAQLMSAQTAMKRPNAGADY